MQNLILSASKLDSVSTCERMFNFEIMMNLAPKEPNRSLEMGSLFHLLMERYLTHKYNKVKFADNITDVMQFGRFTGASEFNLSSNDIETIVRTFKDYAQYYKDEMYVTDSLEKDGKQIATIEVPFAKVIHEDAGLGLRVIVEGTIDWMALQLAMQGRKVIIDHKTGERDYPPERLSNQFMCYPWITGVRAVVVNKVLFQDSSVSPEKRFKRTPFEYDDYEIKEWVESVIVYARRLYEAAQAKKFVPNFTSCTKYGGCKFKEICEQSPIYRPAIVEQKFEVKEPYDKNRFKDKPAIQLIETAK
jgi:hypothetical protein